MHLSQVRGPNDAAWVVSRRGASAHIVKGVSSVYDLAQAAIAAGRSLADQVQPRVWASRSIWPRPPLPGGSTCRSATPILPTCI